ENLRRAEKLLRNMSVVAEIQSSIALIRKHANGSQETIRRFVRDKAQSANDLPPRERFRPGTIVDATAGVDYEFPIAGIDATRYVQILQAELRAIAARLTIPEFMLSSDASNANYSSTSVAEGPAVRNFERMQHELIKEDMKIVWRVVEDAVLRGDLPDDVGRRVSIQAIPPSLAVRDRLSEAQADEILMNAGVISPQTAAMRYGLDPNRERALQRQLRQELASSEKREK
ncbi:MAG: phage portal protein, partial [Thermoguttaceae bacterium]|nr:phage portal protein [Thermoguttaceae bacterium]